jgi:hypothetical protein
VVQFGNGEILADGSIGNSQELIGFSRDIGKVKKAIEDVDFPKGNHHHGPGGQGKPGQGPWELHAGCGFSRAWVRAVPGAGVLRGGTPALPSGVRGAAPTRSSARRGLRE